MGRTEVLQELRLMKFEEINDRYCRGRLSAGAPGAEAAGPSQAVRCPG